MADATLNSLTIFDDPGAWDAIIPGVPVIEPCSFRDDDEEGDGKVYTIDMERLAKIGANMLRDWQDRGLPVRFLEGHTFKPTVERPQIPEKDQPDILAFGIRPRLGRYGPKGLPAILVDQFILKGKAERVRGLPGRSAEWFDDEDRVPAVALLKTEPQCPMGVVLFGQRKQPVFLEKKMGTEPITDPTKPPEAKLDPEFERQFQTCMAKHFKRFSAEDDGDEFGKAMSKHFTGERIRQLMSEALGPTNGATPEPVKKPEEKKPEATQMGNQADPVLLARLSKLEADNAKATADNTRLERELRYGHELSELIRAGRSFDYGKELTFCVTLNPEQFGHYKTRLSMEGAPTGGVPGSTTVPANAEEAMYQRANAILRSKPGMTWHAAVEHAKAGK